MVHERGSGSTLVRVTVYVDGFNLYFGLRAAFGRRYHWLNLQTVAHDLVPPGDSLEAIKYFTARIRNDPPAEHRQDIYLQALDAYAPRLEIIEGRFQKKQVRCRGCQQRWVTYEEKESDVHLGVSLVEDAANDRFDRALLVSADSDLVPAVRAARRLHPAASIVAVFPPARRSPDLAGAAHDVLFVTRAMVNQAQLPPAIITHAGIELSRPAYWN